MNESKRVTFKPPRALISVVIPARNEASVIGKAITEIRRVLDTCSVAYELIVVDDGSEDGTFDRVRALAGDSTAVRGIQLSRNFGKESSLLAGLRRSKGDAVITMDADLQHPPRMIPEMIAQWRAGAKIVHGVKINRSEDGMMARCRAALFNQMLTLLGGIDVRGASDFKLLDREIVDILTNDLREHRRFYRGLTEWLGFESAIVPFEVPAREDGRGKWSLLSLLDLATTAIVSFTSAPLRIVTVLGFIALVFAAGVAGEALWSWFRGESVPGFVTVIVATMLMGSLIMISLGIIGEYIAKIYDEIKARPLYLIESTCGFEEESATRHQREYERVV